MEIKCKIKFEDGRESLRKVRAGMTADDAHYMIMRGFMSGKIVEADIIVGRETIEKVRQINYA